MKFYLNKRSLIAALHDAMMAAASFAIALYVRLGDDQIHLVHPYLGVGTLIGVCICVAVFSAMRLYRGLWRFASMHDMMAIAKAVSLSMLIFAVAMFIYNRLEGVPRSVFFIQGMLLLCMLAGPRILYRSLKDRRLFWEMTLEEKAKIPVLLIGATSLAEQFIQDMQHDPRTAYQVVGILDNDASQHHRQLQRVQVYGAIALLPVMIAELARKGMKPHKILIADPRLSGEVIGHIIHLADAHAVPVARIPRLSDFKRSEQADIQPIALEDLLGRPQMALDKEAMQKLIAGKRVLVTGAGGSIGGELVRQLAGYAPSCLILLDACELNLYQIQREIKSSALQEKTISVLGDVRDERLVKHVFSTHAPEIVFHAAALKHVPMSEENPEETILTNLFGTRIVADACVQHDVPAMVLISTDKAVNPTNIMGATKRMAESYCHSLAKATPSKTRFITVRFGNVLGSTGSVVPLFAEQIAHGGPVTVTHPAITRYFMTIREAVELVVQAAAIGMQMPDARDHIFVLDMGNPIKILDLAEQMIRLAGAKPYEDIPIVFTGLRAGEKLHEELFHAGENQLKTPHASIFLASARANVYSDMAAKMDKLKSACCERRRAHALMLLHELVPEFQPLSEVA